MRITKDAAKSVAKKLTEKKRIQLEKIKSEISETGYKVLKGQTPPAILGLYAKHPAYFKKINNINVTGKGLNHQQIYLSKNLPCTETYSKTVLVDDENAAILSDLFNKKEALHTEIEKLEQEIEQALLSLVTYAKISQEFKEAVPFLPFKEKNELVVNIQDIRKKL